MMERGVERSPQRGSDTLIKLLKMWSGTKEINKERSGEDNMHNGKCKYIAFIMEGAPRASNQSISTTKRNIVDLMSINKKEGSTSTKSPEIHILRFQDMKKVDGFPNKLFPMDPTAAISHFDVSKILIDGGSSCRIIYSCPL